MFKSTYGNVKNKKKKRKVINKSAVFWFVFFSKYFGPGPSSEELQSTNVAIFAFAMKEEKKNAVRALCMRPLRAEGKSEFKQRG